MLPTPGELWTDELDLARLLFVRSKPHAIRGGERYLRGERDSGRERPIDRAVGATLAHMTLVQEVWSPSDGVWVGATLCGGLFRAATGGRPYTFGGINHLWADLDVVGCAQSCWVKHCGAASVTHGERPTWAARVC
jgi:hypothetical protein